MRRWKPHGEGALLRASRTMGRGAILRDASLRDAPQDEASRRGAAQSLSGNAFIVVATLSTRHGRVYPGHPRLCRAKDVDARDKPGHDALENTRFHRAYFRSGSQDEG